MKKIMAALAAMTLAVPAMAEPVIEEWNTFHSMGCMLVRDCKDGVTKVNSVDDLASVLGNDFSSVEEEMTNLLNVFTDLGIEVFIADSKYFVSRTRGIYTTVGNKFYLNKQWMTDPQVVLEVTRHEGWHAAQDCMAGTLQNSHIAVIHHDGYIPSGYRVRADIAYGGGPAVPWETEAMWAGEQSYVTFNALSACANPNGKMWDVYPPTPMTGEWLESNGFWDGVTR